MYKAELVKGFFSNNTHNEPSLFVGLDSYPIYTNKKTVIGIGPLIDGILNELEHQKYSDYYKIFFHLEEPNGYCSKNTYEQICRTEERVNLILSTCPYSTQWKNKYFPNSAERIYIGVPFNPDYKYSGQEKDIDLYLISALRSSSSNQHPSKFVQKLFDTVSSYSSHKIIDSTMFAPVSYAEKIEFNSRAKISVSYGLVFLEQQHIDWIKQIPNWNYNEAFKDIDSGLIPQIKTRTLEAALSKSIILHKKDQWNIIEKWFEPNKDFIYYDDENDLKEKIDEILSNYGNYEHIAESAHKKMLDNYMIQNFINDFKEL